MPLPLYSLLLRLLLPLQVLRFWWRGWRHPVYRGSVRAHLSFGLVVRHDRPLWLHAASAGEVQALAGLLRQLRERHASLPLLLTVGTATGLLRARELFAGWLGEALADGVPVLTVQPAPWDLPGATRRFMRSSSPRLGVFVEKEIWPNLVRSAADSHVPLLLVSARVSVRSTERYRRFMPRLMRDSLRGFAQIAAQSMADRERFIALGADPAQMVVAGNLKFDLPLPTDVAGRGAALRQRIAPHRSVWVAGSTHEGEEAACLEAQRALRASSSAAGSAPLLVLAPRRPERFESVAQWLGTQGVAWARYTSMVQLTDEIDVLLVDRFGELLTCYAAADVCFVGGTLVPVGGHNLLEPAALGKPVLAGPNCFNSAESARLLEASGGLRQVKDERQLTQMLREWLQDTLGASRAGRAAAAAVIANRGAAAQALQAITALLVSDSSKPAPASPSAAG
ncbi:MAG TPA: 3-deoxy-D-manno-octulosonic acid transferase [Steroidobacteraceae bacterium]|nr:3-deoxy-D-manno-octulosonic acid transferase [Steroidobacteraceae bacterium]